MKPMLAAKEPKNINFPVLASPKLDGIRCICHSRQPLSRTMKVIPNLAIQRFFRDEPILEGMDGELIVGEPYGQSVMQRTSSGVMAVHGMPDFSYFVFDNWLLGTDGVPFCRRHDWICERLYMQQDPLANCYRTENPRIFVVGQTIVNSQKELDIFERQCLDLGYEGVMIRSLNGPYKFGRSTANEGYLVKIKRFEDSEATIVGVTPLMKNLNEATINDVGAQVRSHEKAGMMAIDQVGAFEVVDNETHQRFFVGSGFTETQRKAYWALHTAQNSIVGRIITYKHFANSGVKEAPRFPVFKCFRED